MNNKLFLGNLRSIQDWPIKGANFRDVVTLFRNLECLRTISDEMYELYKNESITKIVGIESHGFMMSSTIAIKLGTGIVLCHKSGKLPCETVQESYAKEYGIDIIEVHKDVISKNNIALLHSSLLAVGGTVKVACDLAKKFHPRKVYTSFIIELKSEFPHCREQPNKGIEIEPLL